MKIRILVLLAFDIAAMYVIAQTESIVLIMVLVMCLILTNILLAYVFRRNPFIRTYSFNRIVTLLHWASWTDYIPVLGGTICVFIGMLELMWKPCVIGAVAIASGIWRIWSKGRVRKALRDQR